MTEELHNKRVVVLNDRPVSENGGCIIYWMQRSQRACDNPALSHAAILANDLRKPLLVYFGLYAAYPMASTRAFTFMLEGLKETATAFRERGIGFVVRVELPAEGIARIAEELDACAIVVDEDYLNLGRSLRALAAKELGVRLVQVDSETVAPARTSDREEWGAYTIRPKILKALDECLVDRDEIEVKHKWRTDIEGIEIGGIDPLALAMSLKTDQSVPPSAYFTGGASRARQRLSQFIDGGLPCYGSERNDIGKAVSSDLSPYLHFGQIASLRVALIVREADAPDEAVDAFLEQLIVRRELAINFCLYNRSYAEFAAAADWAARSLRAHASDPRPDLYSLEELETAATYDDLWNVSQTELVRYGKVHPYMRIVWAKKLLEWSPSPEEALRRAIFLNDKYALDGRDPNGYANIAWCILGKHDRPFTERPIFGKIRYMTTESTKRKTHWREYVERVTALQLPGM